MGQNELLRERERRKKQKKKKKMVGTISSESNNLSQQVPSALWNVITTAGLYGC